MQKVIIFSLILGLGLGSVATASELDDRWLEMKRGEMEAKQGRIDEIAHHSTAIQRQIEEERRHLRKSQDRIYQEFIQNLEFERSTITQKLEVLDERRRVFERELEKKRAQDELRVQEKERELQRLFSEVERLRAEIKMDHDQFELRQKAMLERKESEEKARLKFETMGDREEDYQEMKHGSIKIGKASPMSGFESRDFLNPNKQQEYFIEIGDVLEIEVWRVPDLSKVVKVGPDGRIGLPLAGQIEAASLSLIQLKEVITERISEYVLNPQVSVSLQQFGGRKFIVLGEVLNPGVYRYENSINLIEALALGGGFTDVAKGGQVMIIRGDINKSPKVNIIKANMLNLLKQGMLTENIAVKPNDIIYVGRDFLGDYNNVITELVTPALDTVIDFFVARDAIRTVQNRPR